VSVCLALLNLHQFVRLSFSNKLDRLVNGYKLSFNSEFIVSNFFLRLANNLLVIASSFFFLPEFCHFSIPFLQKGIFIIAENSFHQILCI